MVSHGVDRPIRGGFFAERYRELGWGSKQGFSMRLYSLGFKASQLDRAPERLYRT